MALSVVLQGLSALVSFATTAIIFRGLSKEDAGIFSLLSSYIIVTVAFVDFGLVAVVFPKMSFVRGANTPSFKAGFVLRGLMMLIGIIGLTIYMLLIGKPEWILFILMYFGVSVFSSKSSGLRQFFESFLRIKGRTYIVASLAFVDSLIAFLIIFYYLNSKQLTLTHIIATIGLSGIVSFLVITIPVVRLLLKEKVFNHKINFRYYKALLISSLPIALMSIIGQLFSQVETFIINLFLTKADIASYNAAYRPFQGIIFLPVMLSIGLAPVVTQVFKSQRKDVSMASLTEFGVKLFLGISLVVFSVANIFSENIMLIFGKQYATNVDLLKTYSFSSGIGFLIIYFDQMLLAVGFRIKVFYGALIGLLFAIVLETAVIQSFGVKGIMFAKMLSMLSVICFQLYSMTKQMRAGILNGFLKYLPAYIITPIIVYFGNNLPFIVKGIIILIPYAITIWLFKIFTLNEIKTIRNLSI